MIIFVVLFWIISNMFMMRKGKAQLEVNLARDAKNKNKHFDSYMKKDKRNCALPNPTITMSETGTSLQLTWRRPKC